MMLRKKLKSAFLSDEGAKVLADVLKSNITLETLDLSNNPIGIEGAKALAAMLKTNTTIKELKLSKPGWAHASCLFAAYRHK